MNYEARIEIEPERIRRILLRIAGEAAARMRNLACSGEHLAKSVKGETVIADLVSEDYLIGAIREELGNVRIISEERGTVGDGPLTIIVDPLDGSSNYLNCIPWASISLAAVPTGGTVRDAIAGVVAPIFWGPPLSFSRGNGCYAGNTRIRKKARPSRFIFVYIDHPDAAGMIARIIRGLGGGFKVRSLGSAALEIAYTGIGLATAFIDLRSKLRNVDIAAAQGIVRECGGLVVSPDGKPLDVGTEVVMRAGNIIATPDQQSVDVIMRVLHGEP